MDWDKILENAKKQEGPTVSTDALERGKLDGKGGYQPVGKDGKPLIDESIGKEPLRPGDSMGMADKLTQEEALRKALDDYKSKAEAGHVDKFALEKISGGTPADKFTNKSAPIVDDGKSAGASVSHK